MMAPVSHTPARSAARSYAAAPPCTPSGFYCLLDEQPTFLVPQRLLDAQRGDGTRLLVNPRCWFSWNGVPPAEIAPWLELFGQHGGTDTVWITGEATGALLPFWVGRELRPILESAVAGEPLERRIEPHIQRVLQFARILIDPAEGACRQQEWTAAMESARAHFERGYVPLAGLIHPYHLGALRRYYRRQIRTGAFPLGDEQSALRHAAYNEPVARFFHHQLAAIMSAAAGEPVKPSYVYFASYQGGAELERHTDREQCEFSITFCMDYTPEPLSATDWPIHLDTPQGTVIVYQAIGDALLYRGCRVPHYRKRLWRAATSSSIFFHYVRRDFSGPLA